MEIKKKIAVWCALFALLVALVPPSSARAEESTVVEWSNFGEYWIAQGYAIEDLPCEYDANKRYVLIRKSWAGNTDYLFVYDEGIECTSYFRQYEYSRFYYKPSECSAIYSIEYNSVYFDDDTGWNALSTSDTSYTNFYSCAECKYSDFDIENYNTGVTYYHKTRTGESVSFEFALADMSDDLKETLQSYENYVVVRVPYRVNDWQSEQIMIAVSNGSKVIYRSEAYNQIHFSTGSGHDSGLSYIYCSECCQWFCVSSDYGYTIGSTVASGGNYPDILWTNCDIYYEDGISYALTDEIYFEAYPYGGEVEEEVKEVVTDGFPRLFEVDAPVAYVYKYMDAESAVVIALLDGSGGIVTGVEYDDTGKAWYKVSRYYANAEYVGYVDAQFVSVGYSVPSMGNGSDGGEDSPTPTVAPDSGGGGNNADNGSAEDNKTFWQKVIGTLNDIKGMFSQDSNLNGSVSDLTDTLVGIVEMVSVVPLMIGAVFGFLPEWCLVILGASFAFMGILLVIKLIRG